MAFARWPLFTFYAYYSTGCAICQAFFFIFFWRTLFVLIRIGREVPADAVGAILAPLGALAHRVKVARVNLVSHALFSFPLGDYNIAYF